MNFMHRLWIRSSQISFLSLFCLFVFQYRKLSLFFFIKFIGATLVNKMIQVSSVRVYNTWPVCCVVCGHNPAKPPSVTIRLTPTPTPTPDPDPDPDPWSPLACCPSPGGFVCLVHVLLSGLYPTCE